MLFRRKGTASTILAIALLIALLASVNSLVNNINAQTQTLSQLAGVGGTYLVTSKNSASLSDSSVDPGLAGKIQSVSGVKNVLSQNMFQANLATALGNYTISVLGVSDVKSYFTDRHAVVNGSIAVNATQANAGSILAKLASINLNDTATLTFGSQIAQVQVVGIVQTVTESDAELVVPMETADALFSRNGMVSFIEFSLKDPSAGNTVISKVAQLLPEDAQIVKVQQVSLFAQDINSQIVSFLNLWSAVIYIVVIAASYVVASRLVTEAKYELGMFRTLGAKRQAIIRLVFFHTIVVGFVGAVLGVAMGIAGAQAASTAIRWLWGNLQIYPFLDAGQALQIILLALGAAAVGCIYPAVKSARNLSVEASP